MKVVEKPEVARHVMAAVPRILLISPVRNEERLLPGLIRSLTAQTVPPAQWIIVDDGSTDGTLELARAAAREHAWIRVVVRKDRGARKLGGGVVEAFNEGLATVELAYDFVGKLDADLTFGPRYLETLLAQFSADPQLGAASGKVFRPEGDTLVEEFMIDEMVAGQFKVWRQSCFQAIGGLVPEVMWDGIDFHMSRQAGFRTRSIPDENLRILHHRLMGSSDRSIWRGRIRWGKGQWFMGSHPLYILASAVFRMSEKPYLIGGALIFVGYVQAWWKGERRLDKPEFRRELRAWQMARLRQLLFRGKVR